jgi:hypothetical protein
MLKPVKVTFPRSIQEAEKSRHTEQLAGIYNWFTERFDIADLAMRGRRRVRRVFSAFTC